jgi:biopolymer transport protein ExbD/biopolymer transport protein TolR
VAFSSRERTETTLSEINVTPLVDVILVLLIIFMVTAPMLSSSVEVNLPRASVAPPPDAREHLVVTVAADGRVWVADSLADLEVLPFRVQEALRKTGLERVAIRGDRAVPYGAVLAVLDQLKVAGLQQVGLVMAPPEPTPAGGRR